MTSLSTVGVCACAPRLYVGASHVARTGRSLGSTRSPCGRLPLFPLARAQGWMCGRTLLIGRMIGSCEALPTITTDRRRGKRLVLTQWRQKAAGGKATAEDGTRNRRANGQEHENHGPGALLPETATKASMSGAQQQHNAATRSLSNAWVRKGQAKMSCWARDAHDKPPRGRRRSKRRQMSAFFALELTSGSRPGRARPERPGPPENSAHCQNRSHDNDVRPEVEP